MGRTLVRDLLVLAVTLAYVGSAFYVGWTW